ncbi:MAG: M23 family metallopeptidase [Cyanobacteriota bacterium]|nr:M23 family metallopeptidase [Cyanobacteriota bacterium]
MPLLCCAVLGLVVLSGGLTRAHSLPDSRPLAMAMAMPAVVPAQVPVAPLLPQQLLVSRSLGSSQSEAAQLVPPLGYPLASPALQIDPWGWRYSESRGAWRMHTGVDFAADTGTPVLAARGGTVVLAESLSGYGLTVILDHGDGLQTLYAHLQQINVALGSSLNEGESLGTVGMTGTATGPHLHFELRRQGEQALALDPTPHLPPLQPPPALTASRP